MKASIALLSLCVPLCSFAQNADSSAQSLSSSSAVGAQQNQSITIVNPVAAADSRSVSSIESRSTSSSDQNITTSGTTTQNLNSTVSGTSRNIVEYSGTYTVKNVPSVNGPNLTTSNDTCMGSSSGSANGPGFGVSFGTTWTDEHCKRLKMSRELWNKGMKAASLAMDCMDPAARVALEITGSKCPQSMTADERRNHYGPDASAQGSPAPSTAQAVSGTSLEQAIESRQTASLYPN
ncbi:hypothetical protein P608_17715 [Comamonas thiooxydans]|uniref:Uncharacterized protein n=1 Tax=Comamonas thiooxydans TaxID=363952 RepID=A0A0E3BUR8_9BURK|nr:hypothetical protein [Comamonas thiooxydans]KGH08745.1 hypothetical protein P608_17715 [Comamonas thiooxydans]